MTIYDEMIADLEKQIEMYDKIISQHLDRADKFAKGSASYNEEYLTAEYFRGVVGGLEKAIETLTIYKTRALL